MRVKPISYSLFSKNIRIALTFAHLLIIVFGAKSICWPYTAKITLPHMDGSSISAYLFLPSRNPGRPIPGVLVGVGAGSQDFVQYHEHCRALADRNFAVVLMDPANLPEGRTLDPVEWDHGTEAFKASVNQGYVGFKLFFSNWWYLMSIKAGVDYLSSCPWVDHSRIALSGHSQPANAALNYASIDPRVKAVIWNYGGWPWIMPYNVLRLPPVCIFHGVEDEVYDVRYAGQLASNLSSANKKYEVHIYPGQEHMFRVYFDPRKEHRWMKPVILESFERQISFLNRVFYGYYH